MSFIKGESDAIIAATKTLDLIKPTNEERKVLCKVFGLKHLRSFDLVQANGVSLASEDDVAANKDKITLIELKSTKHLSRWITTGRGFTVRFTDNEIETATTLGIQHKVLLWDIGTNQYRWDSVLPMLAKARSISVQRAFTYKG